ncbi:winged helix-turn-helix transcriptional regulator [Candidatus Bathyarchaeota archaeon]|nr:MAG: winged helix-turn-helix transcriptional regulator [Candidatus Bathyarchaeota archaeon]
MERSNRSRVKLLVSFLPGVHLRQIQRILGVSFSSVRYNVDALKRNREVFDWRVSGRSCLFSSGVSEREKILYSHLRSHTFGKILRAIAKDGKLTNHQLSTITGLAKSTLSERIHNLLEVEILMTSFSRDGRVAYQLKEPERLLPMLRAADQTVLEEAADRFIQLWDF